MLNICPSTLRYFDKLSTQCSGHASTNYFATFMRRQDSAGEVLSLSKHGDGRNRTGVQR